MAINESTSAAPKMDGVVIHASSFENLERAAQGLCPDLLSTTDCKVRVCVCARGGRSWPRSFGGQVDRLRWFFFFLPQVDRLLVLREFYQVLNKHFADEASHCHYRLKELGETVGYEWKTLCEATAILIGKSNPGSRTGLVEVAGIGKIRRNAACAAPFFLSTHFFFQAYFFFFLKKKICGMVI